MRSLILLIVAVAIVAPTVSADPPAQQTPVLRPALWWSDLRRVSDGGGPALKASTRLVGDAKGFAEVWAQLGLKGQAPAINFKDYFAVLAFRRDGLDFQLLGGLAIDAAGDAKVVGLPAHPLVTNAGWYSSTLAVFPRTGVVSVDGHKLPKAE